MASKQVKTRGRPKKQTTGEPIQVIPAQMNPVTMDPATLDDDLDMEIIQQIMEIEEKTRQLELDSIVASNIAVEMTDASTQPEDIQEILEQIRQMELSQQPQQPPQHQEQFQYQLPAYSEIQYHPSEREKNERERLDETRLLMRMQEEEYNASLVKDRLKAQLRSEEIERQRLQAQFQYDVEQTTLNNHVIDATAMATGAANSVDDVVDTEDTEEEDVPQSIDELRAARLRFFTNRN
jgi:hypothetical protein